jgi:hypothetical protein
MQIKDIVAGGTVSQTNFKIRLLLTIGLINNETGDQ